ncbi:MAG: TonB-dependent siderophore receptor [Methylomarinum sp.]|nr:TonB-dependent siderophore receptor [Methylomarinum sp.]
MATALINFSETTSTELSYPASLVKDINAKALKGDFTGEQALNKLLENTKITHRFVDDGVVALNTLKDTGMTVESLLAAAGGDFVLAAAEPNDEYTGPVEQEDLTVSGRELNGYSVINSNTATKTDTLIMETPVSIQVVPRTVMDDQQVIRLDRALENVSGVYSQQGFGQVESFNIRGFSTFDYYRNGVRFQSARTQTGTRETANLEKIEVLKGPASILFGRIEPGGMVNLVTKKPQAQPYYSLQQQFGSNDLYRTSVDATGGINQDDSLLYRLNFSYENKGSFRDFVESENVFLAPVLQWKISDRTQVTVDMEYKTGETTPEFGVPAIGDRPANLPVERNLGESFANAEYDEIQVGLHWSHEFNDQWKIQHRFNAQFADENDDVVLPLGLNADNRTLNRFYAGFRDNENDTYSTSLDLTGNFDTFGVNHTVLFGGDYYHFEKSALLIDNFTFPSIDIFNPTHSGLAIRNPADNFSVNITEKWYGLYFQDQMKLPYNIHLLAGFRYDNSEIKQTNSFVGGSRKLSSKQEKISPRVGLLWQPIPEFSLYGNYVENFGAPNLFATGVGGQSLKAETAQQWEAGIKTELMEGRFSATLSWFQLTKQNIATGHPDPALAGLGFSVQTGEAQNEGIELDITGEILPGWNVFANYAYIDSEITQSNGGTQGNRFPNVPEHGGSLWTTYAFQNQHLQGLKVGGGMVARGQREVNQQNNVQMPGYALVNLMAGYEFRVGKSKVSAQLNVDNLLDKRYNPSSAGFGNSRIDVGTPRTFLGSIKLEF